MKRHEQALDTTEISEAFCGDSQQLEIASSIPVMDASWRFWTTSGGVAPLSATVVVKVTVPVGTVVYPFSVWTVVITTVTVLRAYQQISKQTRMEIHTFPRSTLWYLLLLLCR